MHLDLHDVKTKSTTLTIMRTVESEANLGDNIKSLFDFYLFLSALCMVVEVLRYFLYYTSLPWLLRLNWGDIARVLYHTSFSFLSSGGMIVVVMREEYLNIPEYSDSLEPLMKQLQNEGLWMRIERSVVHKYFCDKHGVIFRYRVLHRHLWEPRDTAIQWITEFVYNGTMITKPECTFGFSTHRRALWTNVQTFIFIIPI